MHATLSRWLDPLIAARWLLLALGVLIALVAYVPSRQLTFDRSIERLFAANDPVLAPYQRLKRDFGGNEIVLAVYRDEHLLDPDGDGLARLDAITQRVETVPGIEDVLSLSKINTLLEKLDQGKSLGGLLDHLRGGEAANVQPIVDRDRPLAAKFRELFAGYTHSADGQTAALVCMLKPAGPDAALNVPRETTIKELERIVHELPDGLAPGVLAGEPVMISQGFSLLEVDGRRLAIGTSVLLGLTILVFFRSLRWLVLPLAVVQWSLVVTRAVLVISGLELSLVSSMLSAVVTVVAVATVMHLIVHVRELRTEGDSHRAALKTATILLAGPIVGAVLTDMAGFGSLLGATVQPVRDFGLMMSVGSLLVLPAVAFFFPAIALAATADRPTPKAGWGEMHVGPFLVRSIHALQARRRTVLGSLLLVAAVCSAGVWRLEVETDFTHNFRRHSSIVEAYELVESRLGGAGVLDVIVPAPRILDAAYIERVRWLESKLRTIETTDPASGRSGTALTKVLSVVDALDAVAVDPALATMTPTPELRYQALAAAMPTFMAALRHTTKDGDQGRLRIMLRARERQPAAQKERLIREVTRLAKEAFPDQAQQVEVTGFFVLLTKLIESILRDQWITFAVAFVAIVGMIWIGFRSLPYALIAMIPNAAPIFMVMGLLGWLGLRLNMGAAMIAAVSLGMSVDSSIHYFAAFRRARHRGLSVQAAIEKCQQSVGLAMIFSTVALVIGFSVLITSEFVPTIYFGALMSLAMLGGLLGNLIVLPLMLAWLERE